MFDLPREKTEGNAQCSMLNAQCPMPIAQSSKLIAHSSKPKAHSPKPKAQCPKLKAQSSKLTAHSSKLTAHSSKLKAHRGVTLLELLVVVSIMMMLAAYALPKLAPMARERKIREAARSVSVFLSRAKSRAIETGRPCGVVFQRFGTDPNSPLSNAATMLYQAEVPPPYAGDTLDARIYVWTPGSSIRARFDLGSFTPQRVHVGDRIQINNQGPWYTIDSQSDADGDGVLDNFNAYLTVDYKYHNSLPWPNTWADAAGRPMSFKILRRPTRTIAQPLTLPVGTAVDLSASGIDTDADGTDADGKLFGFGKDDVTIMFSPNGSVGQIYWTSHDPINPAPNPYVFVPHNAVATDQIFLLIGWREQIGEGRQQIIPFPPAGEPQHPGLYEKTIGNIDAIAEEEMPNWYILSNLWVSLTPQSGLVTVADNAFPEKTLGNMTTWNPATKQAALLEARQYARRAQSKGGR